MHVVVKAFPEQREVFLAKGNAGGVRIDMIASGDTFPRDAQAYFDLCYEEEGAAFSSIGHAPVFVNAVIDTHAVLPPNTVRINAWNGFLERDVVEIVPGAQPSAALQGLDALGWKYRSVPDLPGMIAARVIAMIINEAYFGWGDGISSKEDIDTAMKLGTNYPFGPFEWAGKIGLEKIGALLQILSAQDQRYTPAPALLQELKSTPCR